MLTLTQGKKLIKLARKSIDSWFKKKQVDFSHDKGRGDKAINKSKILNKPKP